MFDAFECDSITVPACSEHNNSKGSKDRAIVTWLVKSLDRTMESSLTSDYMTQNVVKAINHIRPNWPQANHELEKKSFLLLKVSAWEIYHKKLDSLSLKIIFAKI